MPVPPLLYVSLAANVLVLVPVTAGLWFDLPWTAAAYGGDAPARRILLAVYLAILIGSLGLLLGCVCWRVLPEAALTLLGLQIVYKLLSSVTVGSLANPVVVSNLAIALLHAVTAVSLVRQLQR